MSTEADPSTRRTVLVDLAPLRESPAFARLWFGNIVSGIGAEMTVVAVGVQVYSLTHSTFAVSLVGVFSLVPMILAGLYGGTLADAFDRRVVLIWASLLAWTATIAIAALAWFQLSTVWPLYLLTVVDAVAATVVATGRGSVVARLVRAELMPAAFALGGIAQGLYVTVGPALGGVLVATAGFGWTYTVDVILFFAAFIAVVRLPPLPPEGARHTPGLQSIRAGLAFLRTAPNIRTSFAMDITAMTFGHPNALFPAIGARMIGGGAVTVGVLSAAVAVGAFLLSLFSGRLAGVRRQGLAVAWSIGAYGACVLGLGIVLLCTGTRGTAATVAPLALGLAVLFLAGAGAADNISSIFRNTITQSAAPDNMRGRLQGIYIVVVTGGPRLGDLFVGVVATVGALWAPPLLGGAIIIVLIAVLLRSRKGFRQYDALNPTP